MRRIAFVMVPFLAIPANAAQIDALYCQRDGAQLLSLKGDDKSVSFEISNFRTDGQYWGMSGKASGSKGGWHHQETGCVVDISRGKSIAVKVRGCESYGGANAVPGPLKFSHRAGKAQSLSLESPSPDC